jgi:two-component system, NarL family, nitrate/nitrite response regulator NarL
LARADSPKSQLCLRLDLSVRTVESHRINIKRKFDLDGTAALMKFAVERKRLKVS